MIFSKIFKFFLIFFLIAAPFVHVCGNIYTVNEQCELHFTPTNELLYPVVREYAHELDNILSHSLPKSPLRNNRNTRKKLRIFFTDKTEQNITVSSNMRIINIHIDGISPQFQNNYDFLHNLFSAVAMQFLMYEKKNINGSWKLPHWVFMALHSKIRSAFSGEKLIRSSRNLPGMRLLAESDVIPDPILIEQCRGNIMSNIEIYFIQDYCRLLFDLALMFSPRDANAPFLYLRELYMENSVSDPAVFQRRILSLLQEQSIIHLQKMLDLPEKYDKNQQFTQFIRFHALHRAYSYSLPPSSRFMRKRLNEIKKIRFAITDQKNKPTGEIIESTIDQLPKLIGKYKEIKKLIQLKKGELLHFRSISSSFFIQEHNNLIELVNDVKDSFFFGTSVSELQDAIADLEKKIDQYEKIEHLLVNTENRTLSMFQIFPHEFSAEKDQRNIEIPQVYIEKLEETEKAYMN